jgi:hypothetical protein
MRKLAWKVQFYSDWVMTLLSDWLDPHFPAEWVKGALVWGLVSSWVVIALFAYLNHHAQAIPESLTVA